MASTHFPLHKAAFTNDASAIRDLLNPLKVDQQAHEDMIDGCDVHGHTPLLIAVMLGHEECVKALIEEGANVMSQGKGIWPPSAEAISLGDRSIAGAIFTAMDQRVMKKLKEKTQKFFDALQGLKDCWLELHWDVHSWVPLVSRVLPHDTIQIWKKANRIRMDSTLLNASEKSLKRGNRSYVIEAKLSKENIPSLHMITIDHESNTYAKEILFSVKGKLKKKSKQDMEEDLNSILSGDLVDGDVTTSTATFPRAQSGWLGWKSDRSETIDGWDCRVHNVENLSFVSQSRTEHLSADDIKRNKDVMMLAARGKLPDDYSPPYRPSLPKPPPCDLTWEQYCELPSDEVRLGRPMAVKKKTRALKGTIWMCDEFPLSLKELSKVVTMVSSKAEQIKKVEAFLNTQLPPGFPVKLEVPVFPTVSVRVVTKKCRVETIPDSVFEVPEGMTEISVEEMEGKSRDSDDESEYEDEDLPIAGPPDANGSDDDGGDGSNSDGDKDDFQDAGDEISEA